jgi:hypothetical protein
MKATSVDWLGALGAMDFDELQEEVETERQLHGPRPTDPAALAEWLLDLYGPDPRTWVSPLKEKSYQQFKAENNQQRKEMRRPQGLELKHLRQAALWLAKYNLPVPAELTQAIKSTEAKLLSLNCLDRNIDVDLENELADLVDLLVQNGFVATHKPRPARPARPAAEEAYDLVTGTHRPARRATKGRPANLSATRLVAKRYLMGDCRPDSDAYETLLKKTSRALLAQYERRWKPEKGAANAARPPAGHRG